MKLSDLLADKIDNEFIQGIIFITKVVRGLPILFLPRLANQHRTLRMMLEQGLFATSEA
jgi:hypothetical protein